jgi:cytochrome o ubiquinol oxidase subunit II
VKRLHTLLLLPALSLLSGCDSVVLHPSGDVAAQQRDLLIDATLMMLVIIIPVIALTVLFAWRYRQSNKEAAYRPDWDHSTQLELVIWGCPLLIIIFLGAFTWLGTHLLDPYHPLNRMSASVPADPTELPVEVDVVALDWKWLFIYPKYGVASVNTLAVPVDKKLEFHITSATVMNSFFIPAMAGQIYAMPAMQTQLHAVINKAGEYEGLSANYSGAGFSHMHFAVHALDDAGFDAWVAKVKADGDALDDKTYLALEQPSENVPAHTYASVDGKLFEKVLELCVQPGKMCSGQMAAIDARGGLGLAGINNIMPLEYDKFGRPGAVFGSQPGYVASICEPATPDLKHLPAQVAPPPPHRLSPLHGFGLARPVSFSQTLN